MSVLRTCDFNNARCADFIDIAFHNAAAIEEIDRHLPTFLNNGFRGRLPVAFEFYGGAVLI